MTNKDHQPIYADVRVEVKIPTQKNARERWRRLEDLAALSGYPPVEVELLRQIASALTEGVVSITIDQLTTMAAGLKARAKAKRK